MNRIYVAILNNNKTSNKRIAQSITNKFSNDRKAISASMYDVVPTISRLDHEQETDDLLYGHSFPLTTNSHINDDQTISYMPMEQDMMIPNNNNPQMINQHTSNDIIVRTMLEEEPQLIPTEFKFNPTKFKINPTDLEINPTKYHPINADKSTSNTMELNLSSMIINI